MNVWVTFVWSHQKFKTLLHLKHLDVFREVEKKQGSTEHYLKKKNFNVFRFFNYKKS